MSFALSAERVRRDVDVLARAGLDTETFVGEAITSMARALPFVAACLATIDPGTRLLTSARKFGALQGRDTHDHEWALLEYGEVEETSFSRLAEGTDDAVGLHLVTGGAVHTSPRMERFMSPHFGFSDELRVVFRDRGHLWGSLAVFRDPDSGSFVEHEVDFVGSLAPTFARGLRAGMLATLASAPVTDLSGPVVLVVGPDNLVRLTSPGAEEQLAALGTPDDWGRPIGLITGVVTAARGYARGESPVPPRCRVRARDGRWLVMHATPLTTGDGAASGEVVVTIEEARPPEIVSLVVAAFDLTPRERDVTQLVLQGVDTKEIAATMHVSTYTVQDHLKSVFDKVDVRSRRELIARIYFDQYVPRMGTQVAPSGWFSAG